MKSEVKMVCDGNGAIGWKLLQQHPDQDWCDLLEEVALGHVEQLSPRDRERFTDACQLGQGPDADADVNGVRWVVPSEHEPASLLWSIHNVEGGRTLDATASGGDPEALANAIRSWSECTADYVVRVNGEEMSGNEAFERFC